MTPFLFASVGADVSTSTISRVKNPFWIFGDSNDSPPAWEAVKMIAALRRVRSVVDVPIAVVEEDAARRRGEGRGWSGRRGRRSSETARGLPHRR
jgi:hypothetical protein